MDPPDYRQVAGVSLVVMGLVTLLGFGTAASLYPGYSVADQSMSAMGAADAPAASSIVFNGAMVVAGLLTLVAAVVLYRPTERRLLTVVVAVTGVGGFGVLELVALVLVVMLGPDNPLGVGGLKRYVASLVLISAIGVRWRPGGTESIRGLTRGRGRQWSATGDGWRRVNRDPAGPHLTLALDRASPSAATIAGYLCETP